MRRMKKYVGAVIGLSLFAAMAIGSGSTNSTPEKIGEVSSDESDQAGADAGATEEEFEKKDEYHVGDALKDGDTKIVYVSSGEYTETNEFMQPADGNKLVFIKLAFENQGNSDTSVSFYSFEGYADGYSVDMHYSDDNALSATLSAGRTTEGMLIFEVPQDAQLIEIEYETNIFTSEKIKFIYDGEKDSGYVSNTEVKESENAFKVGDIIDAGDLKISYLSSENDTSYSTFSEPKEGYHYVTITLEFENVGSSDQSLSMYDYDCYADGANCEQAFFRDDTINASISAGKKAKGTVTYEIPDGASIVEIEYVANVWTSDRIIFSVTE